MRYEIAFDKKQYSNLQRMLKKLPEQWQRDDAMLGIFRKAGKPMLAQGEASLKSHVPNLGSKSDIRWQSKVDKSRTVIRVGMVNKGAGRLGHLFNWGTASREQYTTGRKTGKIRANAWWDKAVVTAMPSVLKIIDTESYKTIGRYVRRYLK